MNEQPNHQVPQGHERDAVNARAMGWWVLGLVVVLTLTLLLMWAVVVFFGKAGDDQPTATETDGPSFAARPETPMMGSQLAASRQAQLQRLTEYAWVDRENGIARIPIDQAMQLLLERGLPTRDSKEEESP